VVDWFVLDVLDSANLGLQKGDELFFCSFSYYLSDSFFADL